MATLFCGGVVNLGGILYNKTNKIGGEGGEMYRIGVISDTHGLLREEVSEILKTCDVILHAGDIDRQSVLDELEKLKPLYVVRGNADKEWAEELPKTLLVELCGYRFFMVHNRKELTEQAEHADFVIFGHSHKYEDKYSEGQQWLNPGSCGKRRFTQPITMAVIEIEDNGRYRILRKDFAGEAPVSLPGKEKNQAQIIRAVMGEIEKGRSVEAIAKKCRISKELAEQICRMYTTHPGIDVDGILNRIAK